MNHNINNDRCAKQSGYGADTQFRRCKHRPRDEIAQQAESRTAEKARRYHQDRLCRAEQAFRKMRNRDADERDWSGKRRYTRREHARQQDQHHAERGDIDAHTAGIPLSELVRADRLGQQEHATSDTSTTGVITRILSQEMPEKLPIDQLCRLTILESSAKVMTKSVTAEQI